MIKEIEYKYSPSLVEKISDRERRFFFFFHIMVFSFLIVYASKIHQIGTDYKFSCVFVLLITISLTEFLLGYLRLERMKRLFNKSLIKLNMNDDFISMKSNGVYIEVAWSKVRKIKKYKEAWVLYGLIGNVAFIIPTFYLSEEVRFLIDSKC